MSFHKCSAYPPPPFPTSESHINALYWTIMALFLKGPISFSSWWLPLNYLSQVKCLWKILGIFHDPCMWQSSFQKYLQDKCKLLILYFFDINFGLYKLGDNTMLHVEGDQLEIYVVVTFNWHNSVLQSKLYLWGCDYRNFRNHVRIKKINLIHWG